MADSMSITGGTSNIDTSRWKKLTAEEIIKEKSKGEDIPTEIVTWAQQMAAFAKIPVIKKHASENLIIQVDGGINAETARICTSYGANSLVAGSYIYKSCDIQAAIKSLR